MHDFSTDPDQNLFSEQQIQLAIRNARVMCVAFAVGAAMFAVVALVVNMANGGPFIGSQGTTMCVALSIVAVIPVVIALLFGGRLDRNLTTQRITGEYLAELGETAHSALIGGAVLVGTLIEGGTLLSVIAGLLGGPVYLIESAVLMGFQVVHIMRVPDMVRRAAAIANAQAQE